MELNQEQKIHFTSGTKNDYHKPYTVGIVNASKVASPPTRKIDTRITQSISVSDACNNDIEYFFYLETAVRIPVKTFIGSKTIFKIPLIFTKLFHIRLAEKLVYTRSWQTLRMQKVKTSQLKT